MIDPIPTNRRFALALVLPPLLLAVLEVFHARGHHDAIFERLAPQVDAWLIVHFLQLVLFPAVAYSVLSLTLGTKTWIAKTCSIALPVYGIGYVAYDSIAGIGTGILLKVALEFGAIEGIPGNFTTIMTEVIQEYYDSPYLFGIAAVAVGAGVVGFFLTGYQLYQRGYGTLQLLMFTGAAWGICGTHSPPRGPITFGFLAVGMLLVLFKQGSRTSSEQVSA